MGMKISTYPKTAENVLGKIYDLITRYYRDMNEYRHYSITDMFDYIRTIPYVPDPPRKELIMRPKLLLIRNGGDCDDKTIMGCSYFLCRGMRTGFALVSDSSNKPVHHIFTIFENYGRWYDFDATYDYNQFLEKKIWYNRKDFYI